MNASGRPGEAGAVGAWIVAFVLTAGVGFGALVGIGCAFGANACPFSDHALTTTSGPEVWRARCVACHGPAAEGTAHGPSLLTGERASFPLDTLVSKIERGRPFQGMPRFKGDLTDEQIRAVARYVVELREAS